MRRRYGDPLPERNQGPGRWNDHLGKDAVKGPFLALPLHKACQLVEFIVRHSYVRFGQQVYRQTTGIPMGVNPGVYLANFYLYDSEFTFFRQFYDLLAQFPPALQAPYPNPVALQFLEYEDLHFVLQNASSGQIGDAILYVLSSFQHVARFVDDVITGPNRFIRQLVHVTDSLLGGLIKGIYPDYLNLKESKPAAAGVGPHAPLRVNALDTTIISRPVTTSDGRVVMMATTHLYDKRREPCFVGLTGIRFGHVSSNVANSSHYAVIMSALNRTLVACGDLANFADEVAICVKQLQDSGYKQRKVWCTVKRFVMSIPVAARYGESNPIYVFALIYHAFCILTGGPSPFGQHIVRQYFYEQYRFQRRWWRDRLPC